MRKKLLNNNITGAISKGGVLYRPGEIPTLTKEQIAQAKLVNQLPQDFPFANWENMTARQQQQTISRSGLTAQDQWSLLNSNIPLAVLNEHNQAQNQSESSALAARVAASLLNAKAPAAVGKPTVSTPLQKAVLNGQLGGSVDALSANLKAVPSSKGEEVLEKVHSGEQSPVPLPTPTPNPLPSPTTKPDETPLPESGPSLDTFGIDTRYLSEEYRKKLELILEKMKSSVASPETYGTYIEELQSLREEEEKQQYFEKIKSGASAEVTWGTEMIYDQSKYEKIPGTFGPWGNIPEKVCGAFSIHNLNQILGIKTRTDDLLFIFNRNALLTTNLFGAFGVRPGAIEDFYKAAGCEVTRYNDPAKVSKDHDGYIVMFLYPNGSSIFPGGHYVAAEYDKKNDCFYVYNNFVHDGKEKWETLSPSSYKASADRNGYNGESFGWTIWGIDKPKQPQVKKPQHVTKATTGSKGKWIRTSR